MKRFFKPLLLIALVVILTVTIIVPAKSYSAEVIHLPGYQGSGPYGVTCYCPAIFFYECGCAIFLQ